MKKLICIILAEIIIISAACFMGANKQYVRGIAADKNGNFVVNIYLGSQQTTDLLFYDPEFRLIGSVTSNARGGLSIGVFDKYVAAQNGRGETSLYDFKGNAVSDIAYTGDVIRDKTSYISDSFSLNCGKSGMHEYVYRTSGSGTVSADLNYDKYIQYKIRSIIMTTIVFNILFFCVLNEFKKYAAEPK